MQWVHRARPQDVVPTRWERLAEHRFLVEGQWPEHHPFFAPVGGLHDPLLLVESMRQSTILLGHAAYGVPLDTHYLMWSLDFTCRPHHLPVGYGPDVEIEVGFDELSHRGRTLAGMRATVTVRRSGHEVGTGVSRVNLISARAYRRMRGDTARLPPPRQYAPDVPPQLVGRLRSEDVLLLPTGIWGHWILKVDTGHRTLYQGPKDHVPGMVLIEAARQAAHATIGPSAFAPWSGDTSFHRYAEFSRPLLMEVTDVSLSGPDWAMKVTGHQDGEAVFTSILSAGQPRRLP
ncbi:ScbA/BarX family gamma-butyrolactone biosynthesis protein [Streptomyces sp. NPDC001941]|uniref:ScbA/BarX family gamma-butyrolactone biosynthesis protein n=1 Tax=Streptomyces sp. NPDC001941 TaxID=3154659 RepID=UPI0033171E13